jgi:hypothetical protein
MSDATARAVVSFGMILLATFPVCSGQLDAVHHLHGSGSTPSLGLILQSAGWLTLTGAVLACTVGIGSLTGSRAVTLTAAIGWEVVASNLLLTAGFLGSARRGILSAALDNLAPISGVRPNVTMAEGLAVIVLIVWTAAAIALGAWRTKTLDA